MAETSAWMRFYIGDYHRDTAHLTGAEHGAYLLLLMHGWVNGGLLPVDDRRLRIIAKTETREWTEMRDTIMAFFQPTEGGYRQKRQMSELATANQRGEQRKAAGIASAAQREAQRKSNENPTDGQQGSNENPSRSLSLSLSLSDSGSESERPPTPRRRGERAIEPSEDFEAFWLKYPRRIKKETARKAFAKAMTITTLPAILAALDRQPPARGGVDFEPYPATWLNAQSWLDEHDTTDPVLAVFQRAEQVH